MCGSGAVCFSLEVPVNISKSDCTVIRVNKRRLLNPFRLIRGSYHSEIWGDARDLSALPLSQGPFEQRDSLWRWHCISKKPVWNLYSLKSPLIKQSLGGGCKKCMGDSSEGWCFSPATYSIMCCKCHINCDCVWLLYKCSDLYIPKHHSCHCNGCSNRAFS